MPVRPLFQTVPLQPVAGPSHARRRPVAGPSQSRRSPSQVVAARRRPSDVTAAPVHDQAGFEVINKFRISRFLKLVSKIGDCKSK